MFIARASSLVLFTLFLAACASEPAPDADSSSSDPAAVVDSTVMSTALAGPKINLNAATTDEFKTVPEVGDRMAKEFDEYRPYVSILEFRREMGKYVDAEQIAGYEKYVFVPVSPNDSDAETLAQLPGVDASVAATLIAARPFDSDDAFLTALAPLVTHDELALAASYLVTE